MFPLRSSNMKNSRRISILKSVFFFNLKGKWAYKKQLISVATDAICRENAACHCVVQSLHIIYTLCYTPVAGVECTYVSESLSKGLLLVISITGDREVSCQLACLPYR